jgi:hypothetical protein
VSTGRVCDSIISSSVPIASDVEMSTSERGSFEGIQDDVGAFSLYLRTASDAGDAVVVAVHAVNTETRAGKYEPVDEIMAGATFEAVRVVHIVAGHEGFVEDSLVAGVAAIWTTCANRLVIYEENGIGGVDAVVTLGTLETVDMKERVSGSVARSKAEDS